MAGRTRAILLVAARDGDVPAAAVVRVVDAVDQVVAAAVVAGREEEILRPEVARVVLAAITIVDVRVLRRGKWKIRIPGKLIAGSPFFIVRLSPC